MHRTKSISSRTSIPDLPLEGTCRCGKTGIVITAPPVMTAACHCTGCQRMSASAYSLTAMIPAHAFTVSRGEPVIGGARGPEHHHFFCPDCMSWMFTRFKDIEDFVNVRPTMFSDTAWFSPFIETMTVNKLAWVTIPAVHSFEQFPLMSEFHNLMTEFAGSE